MYVCSSEQFHEETVYDAIALILYSCKHAVTFYSVVIRPTHRRVARLNQFA